MNALEEIQNTRTRLITEIDSVFEELIKKLENNGEVKIDKSSFTDFEMKYSIRTPSLFKGKKPTAIYFGEERVGKSR